jgi:hypothetical protein
MRAAPMHRGATLAAGEYARAKALPKESPLGRSQTRKSDRLRQPPLCRMKVWAATFLPTTVVYAMVERNERGSH